MTIAEVLPNLKELQDTNKIQCFNSLQCFFKLRTNLRKHTKHVCNIPHKKVSKRRSTAENFLSHMLKIEINFLIKIDDNFKIEKRLFLVLQNRCS